MTFAIVNVLPEPVTPRRQMSITLLLRASVICRMASGWSPEGWYAEFRWNFMVQRYSLYVDNAIGESLLYFALLNFICLSMQDQAVDYYFIHPVRENNVAGEGKVERFDML